MLCQFFLMKRQRELESRSCWVGVLGLICGIYLEPNKSFYGIQNGCSGVMPHVGKQGSHRGLTLSLLNPT